MHSKPGKRWGNHDLHIIQGAASSKTNQCWTTREHKMDDVVRSSTAFRPCRRRLLPLWNPKLPTEDLLSLALLF